MNKIIIYKINRTIVSCIFILTMGSCGIYETFQTPRYDITDKAYGDIISPDTASTGNIHWQTFFQDEKLHALIETALKNNADMQSAILKIQAAQASLKASKLAFLPSFNVSPSADFDGSWDVQLPVNASWEVDLFGNLRNAKKRKQAAYLQSGAYMQAVRSQLIATVASTYYTLLSLDAQYKIYEVTEQSWKQNVEVTRRLMKAGKYNAASLSQTEANYYNVCNNLIDIQQEIQQTENQLCALLGETPHPIERGELADWLAPEVIHVGVPLHVLSNRPDVKQAEYTLAQAFYATNEARAAFYPALTISGNYEFRHSLYDIVGSLVQPLFQRGTLKANLDIAKAEQKEADISFRQTIIEAGIEVNDALVAVKSAREKAENYSKQVKHLQDAVKSTQLLMKHGSTTYLEVLTAQQTLLEAQVNQVTNHLTEISNTITLYQALGGGR